MVLVPLPLVNSEELTEAMFVCIMDIAKLFREYSKPLRGVGVQVGEKAHDVAVKHLGPACEGLVKCALYLVPLVIEYLLVQLVRYVGLQQGATTGTTTPPAADREPELAF